MNHVSLTDGQVWGKNNKSKVIEKQLLVAEIKEIILDFYNWDNYMIIALTYLITKVNRPFISVYDLDQFRNDWQSIYDELDSNYYSDPVRLYNSLLSGFIINLDTTQIKNIKELSKQFFERFIDDDNEFVWKSARSLFFRDLFLSEFTNFWQIERRDCYDYKDKNYDKIIKWRHWSWDLSTPIPIVAQTGNKFRNKIFISRNPNVYVTFIANYKGKCNLFWAIINVDDKITERFVKESHILKYNAGTIHLIMRICSNIAGMS